MRYVNNLPVKKRWHKKKHVHKHKRINAAYRSARLRRQAA